ncbi:MAG: hypothetical protein AAB285_05940, partial [candidate division NC10 bacterium]
MNWEGKARSLRPREDPRKSWKKAPQRARRFSHRTRFATRDAYLRRVLPHELLRQNLFYAVHPNTQDYVHATIQTTAVVLLTQG